jgi:hypothetical protein
LGQGGIEALYTPSDGSKQ